MNDTWHIKSFLTLAKLQKQCVGKPSIPYDSVACKTAFSKNKLK